VKERLGVGGGRMPPTNTPLLSFLRARQSGYK